MEMGIEFDVDNFSGTNQDYAELLAKNNKLKNNANAYLEVSKPFSNVSLFLIHYPYRYLHCHHFL